MAEEAIKQIKSIPINRLKAKQCDALEKAIEALEKQTPKEPIDKIMYKECPVCGAVDLYRYCPECGQAIKFE